MTRYPFPRYRTMPEHEQRNNLRIEKITKQMEGHTIVCVGTGNNRRSGHFLAEVVEVKRTKCVLKKTESGSTFEARIDGTDSHNYSYDYYANEEIMMLDRTRYSMAMELRDGKLSVEQLRAIHSIIYPSE